MDRFTGLLGILLLLGVGIALSERRSRIPWRIVALGTLLQFALAGVLLAFPPAVAAFDLIAEGVNAVIASADEGIRFVFGRLGDPSGPWGFLFFARPLAVIIYFAALMSVLYHLGLMQRVVAALAWLLQRTLRVSGVEAMVTAANVFVGQTEAPLCIRPYIGAMTRSQVMVLMTGGFATIAGSVLGAYVGLIGGEDQASRIEFAKHLMAASVMSAPAAFVFAKLLVPDEDMPASTGLLPASEAPDTRNVLDAAAVGASDGVRLAINVGAMLIAFVSLLALVNLPIGWLGRQIGEDGLSLQLILGWLFTPMAWVMGIPSAETSQVGSLLGQKLILTEFVANASLAEMVHDAEAPMSHRSAAMSAYALCGFANFPSIAIQIGGLSALCPSKRQVFASLGLRAMIGGAMASWMTACVAGLFLPAAP